MADVVLSWTQPANVADQTSVKIYLKSGNHTAVSDMAAFRSGATLGATESVGGAGTTQTYTDSGRAAGTYTYGAFSHNTAGFGPGDLLNSTVTVS